MLVKYFFICSLAELILRLSTHDEGASNYVFENEIMKGFETLRKIMKEGDAQNGIPPMEPIHVPESLIDFYIEYTELKGEFRSTEIKNASDFRVTNVTLDIFPKKELKLKILFDEVHISGYYNLLGTLFGEYPVRGFGTYKVRLNGFAVSGDAIFGSKGGIINVRYLNASFDVEGISVTYKNQLEGDHEQSFEQKFLLNILDRFRVVYLPRLLNTLKIIINDFLVRTPLTE